VILENEIMDIAMTTVSRETPLILSASHGQEEAALQLLTAIPCDMLEVCASDSRGWQAVHYAAQHGMARLVATLLDNGASPEAQDSKLRLTPLMIACQSGQVEVVKLLLERGKIFIVLCILMPCFCGAGAQTSSVDVTHLTALHHACMASAAGCVRQLLAQPGIELDSQDLSGCTALLYCLKNRNSDLEKLLVNHGASLTAALDSGFSDLCYHTVQDNHSS
jgi:ankyrin repeat protein